MRLSYVCSVVVLALLPGCTATCEDACSDSYNDCLDSASPGAERADCSAEYSDCMQRCADQPALASAGGKVSTRASSSR